MQGLSQPEESCLYASAYLWRDGFPGGILSLSIIEIRRRGSLATLNVAEPILKRTIVEVRGRVTLIDNILGSLVIPGVEIYSQNNMLWDFSISLCA